MCEGRQVLVVEDTPELRRLLAAALDDEGYTVAVAADGAEALAMLDTVAPCVILLDLRMPVMDGQTFARAYRARGDADAHIVVMTAELRPQALAGMAPAAVLVKPFDLDQLVSLVDRLVRAHPATPS
jgi:two-component system, OmpR family, response regulator MprA